MDVKSFPQQDNLPKQVLFSPASPPSVASSPSHEFSFTISLHPSSMGIPHRTIPNQSSFALDLSPADDIFFHGHLLPLHLLSNLPVSPRTSTNSVDCFPQRKKEFREVQQEISEVKRDANVIKEDKRNSCDDLWDAKIRGGSESFSIHRERTYSFESNERRKAKSFSIFGWRRGSDVRVKEEKEKVKRRQVFEVSELVKRYARKVRPLLLFKGKEDNNHLRKHAFSFSDSRNLKPTKQWRGEFSAPASRRTSPNNSGHLLPIPSSTSDSTMEELQAAIQAAIAHCKKSISPEEKVK